MTFSKKYILSLWEDDYLTIILVKSYKLISSDLLYLDNTPFFLTCKNETYINNKNVASSAQDVVKENDHNYTKCLIKIEDISIGTANLYPNKE